MLGNQSILLQSIKSLHKQFKEFLKLLNTDFGYVSYNTDVGWDNCDIIFRQFLYLFSGNKIFLKKLIVLKEEI